MRLEFGRCQARLLLLLRLRLRWRCFPLYCNLQCGSTCIYFLSIIHYLLRTRIIQHICCENPVSCRRLRHMAVIRIGGRAIASQAHQVCDTCRHKSKAQHVEFQPSWHRAGETLCLEISLAATSAHSMNPIASIFGSLALPTPADGAICKLDS